MVIVHNREFVDGILKRHRTGTVDYYCGAAVIYRIQKESSRLKVDQKFVNRLLAKEVHVWVKQYEKKYYQQVTGEDNRRLIRTVEQIYSQPGDKKQLVTLLQKLGVVTKNQREWKETKEILRQYEEEIAKLKKRISTQEEIITNLSVREEKQLSSKTLTHEVMKKIKSEIRMERLRYGLDI